jgi:cytochrome P450
MTRARFEVTSFLADPFAALRTARRSGSVVELELGGGAGIMTHDRVRSLLGDGRLRANFSDFMRTFGVTSGPFYDWMAVSPLNRDGAEHQRWRALMTRTFTPRSVERLRPFLRAAAHQLIDGFAARGACEFMDEFADAYPSLGLCQHHRPRLQPAGRPAHRRRRRGAGAAPRLHERAGGEAAHRSA